MQTPPPLVVAPQPVQVPAGLRDCPGPVAAPPAPRAPRTIEAVGVWAGRVDAAREATERARAECARKLERLNERWRELPSRAEPAKP